MSSPCRCTDNSYQWLRHTVSAFRFRALALAREFRICAETSARSALEVDIDRILGDHGWSARFGRPGPDCRGQHRAIAPPGARERTSAKPRLSFAVAPAPRLPAHPRCLRSSRRGACRFFARDSVSCDQAAARCSCSGRAVLRRVHVRVEPPAIVGSAVRTRIDPRQRIGAGS